MRIGFFYDNTKEHFSIGYGINEGYTAYCNFKLFGSAIAYPFESLVSKTIEEIIGENTMEELFFNADLKRLIQELQKYVSENEIIDFLCKLDTFTYNLKDFLLMRLIPFLNGMPKHFLLVL